MGASNKVCPNCGRKMKQQFIGLQHCRCGMSWKKGSGFFERTPDMIFALERRQIGKKVKQRPVIRKGRNRNSTKKEGRAIAKNGSPFSIIQIAVYSAVEALPEHLTRFLPAVHANRRFAAQQPDLPD